MALVGKVVDRRYGVRSVIGEGGMGAVYEAEHLTLGRLVALKVLHPSNAAKPEAVSRFQHEARVVSSIGHPNICELYDVGKLEDGTPFLVMERLVGDTLADRINKEGALPHDVTFDTLLQILGGLAAAHRKGIIHRDLKPENIFLSRTPGSTEPIAKLLDFGISKMSVMDVDLHLTRTGMVMGTPYYMAPEQARGDRIDHRVDLYAIGVIFYECLTGRRPFLAPNYNALLVQILTGKPRQVRSIRPALSEAFEPVVAKALQKNPEERFQTAVEFHDVLLKLKAEINLESIRTEAARKVAEQKSSPDLGSIPPSEIPIHFSPGTGSGEIAQAVIPPALELPSLARSNEITEERLPLLSLSPPPSHDTYVDDGPPSFDTEMTQVDAPRSFPPPLTNAPDLTTPSRPLNMDEAEEIIRAAQKRSKTAPLKQNPLRPPQGLLASPTQRESKPIIPREEPSAPSPARSRIAKPNARSHPPLSPPSVPPDAFITERADPPEIPLEKGIVPDHGSLQIPPLPKDLIPSPLRRRVPAPPAPISPSSGATVPQPFPSAPTRKTPALPPKPRLEDTDDNDPTILYRPGSVQLPPEIEKLRNTTKPPRFIPKPPGKPKR